MKIAFLETKKWEEDYLKERLPEEDVFFFEEPLSINNLAIDKDFEIISPFIYSKITEEVLTGLPKLRLLATRSTGFDHIDTKFCKENEISVCNVPFYGENTVAEHTFALILALSRKLPESLQRARSGDFSLDGLTGFDLKDKIIGIIGLGHIGERMAKIAAGFEMKILAYDVKQDKENEKKLGLKYDNLNNILEKADIISLHAPLNEGTKHLLNSENINKLKKGSYLVNTSRGGLIETQAVLYALSEGILAGVALDVLEEECFIKEEAQLLSSEFPKTCDMKTALQNHILLQHKKVLVTPHNAFNSEEALKRILDTTVENIQSFKKNKSINLV